MGLIFVAVGAAMILIIVLMLVVFLVREAVKEGDPTPAIWAAGILAVVFIFSGVALAAWEQTQ